MIYTYIYVISSDRVQMWPRRTTGPEVYVPPCVVKTVAVHLTANPANANVSAVSIILGS